MSILLALALFLQSAGGRQVEVTVRDAQGLAVEGASITLTEKASGARKTATSGDDKTRIDGLAAGEYEIRIEKDGFAAKTATADLRSSNSAAVNIELEVGGLSKNVIVSATRTEQEIGNIPANVTLVSREDMKQSPAIAADDILRQVPTFSLFRRSSSLAANPTTQGVSLRGIGPSGASRTLVLMDNVPFNDPFGGWVYWTRIPMLNVRRVDVVEGANSSVYGNYAVGGVMNIVTNPIEGKTFKLRATGGDRQTWKEEFVAAASTEKFGTQIEGTIVDTNGYYTVPVMDGPSALRGPVDTKASLNNENFNVKFDFSPTNRINTFVRSGYFSEHRTNAKVGETNDTLWKYVSGGATARLSDNSDIQARVWGNFERFHQLTLAISSVGGVSRNTSRLTLRQAVPSRDTGGMAQWSKAFGSRNYLTVGTDWRWTDGDSVEDVMNGTGSAVATFRNAGGTQKSVGIFIQDMISVTPKFQLTLSARGDHWRNYDAHNLETSATTGAATTNNAPSCDTSPNTAGCFKSKKNTIGNPKVGAVYHVNEKISLWSSLSWGFRAPSLNELYRRFTVGAITTLANENLGPERVVAGDGGINYTPMRNLTWRSTWFVNKFSNAITNVTQNASDTQRRRQNVGQTRIWGLQSEVDYRVKTYWKFGMSYLYDVAKVTRAATDAAGNTLQGKIIAEVPRHRGTADVSYSNPKYITASLSTQFVGGQYDNDLNTLWLPYYALVDMNLSRRVGRNMEMFFGIQNLLNRRFFVQRVPSTTGAPRFFTGGLEISWNGR